MPEPEEPEPEEPEPEPRVPEQSGPPPELRHEMVNAAVAAAAREAVCMVAKAEGAVSDVASAWVPKPDESARSKPQRGARSGGRARKSAAVAAPDLFAGLPDDPFAGLQVPELQTSSNRSWSSRNSRSRARGASPRGTDGAAPPTGAAEQSFGALPSTAAGRLQESSPGGRPKLKPKSAWRANRGAGDGSDDDSDSGDELLAELGIESHKTFLKSRQKRPVAVATGSSSEESTAVQGSPTRATAQRPAPARGMLRRAGAPGRSSGVKEAPTTSVAEGVPPAEARPPSEGVPPMRA